MACIYVKYITVRGRLEQTFSGYTGRSPATKALLGRYLYDHTKIIDWSDDGCEFEAFLRTETTESDERVQFLADYQAGRLNSGLMAARVYDNLKAAHEGLRA